MDIILEKLDVALGKKQKKSTIAEVNSKVVQKVEYIYIYNI